jgi:hypothetical protein
MFLDSYNPYRAVGSNPVLEREVASEVIQQQRLLPHLVYDNVKLNPLLVVGVPLTMVLLGNLICSSLWRGVDLAPLMLLAVEPLVSLGADVWSSFRTIMLLQPRLRGDTWDMLRITPLGERTLVDTYFLVAQVNNWRALQWATAIRRIYWFMATIPLACYLILFGTLSLPYLSYSLNSWPRQGVPSDFEGVLQVFAVGALIGALGMIYLRESLWRFRVAQAGALFFAARFADSTMALSAAVALGIGLRLALIVIFVAVFWILNLVVTALATLPDFLPLVYVAVIVVCFFSIRVAGVAYWRVERLFLHQTAAHLRRGE